MKVVKMGTQGLMHWTYWLAGAIGLAFIACLLVYAATRDRRRGQEVVGDLPDRTADRRGSAGGFAGEHGDPHGG